MDAGGRNAMKCSVLYVHLSMPSANSKSKAKEISKPILIAEPLVSQEKVPPKLHSILVQFVQPNKYSETPFICSHVRPKFSIIFPILKMILSGLLTHHRQPRKHHPYPQAHHHLCPLHKFPRHQGIR